MTAPPRANAEAVMMGWLRTLADLPSQQIATALPERSPDFAANGFVLVASLGGAPDENGMHVSVLGVETYAYRERRAQLPWATAANMWSAISHAAQDWRTAWLALLADYGQVLLRDVSVLTEPRRMPTNVRRPTTPPTTEYYARYGGDVQITWTQSDPYAGFAPVPAEAGDYGGY